jgi:hypothetical protein
MDLFSLAGSLNPANRTALPGNAGAKMTNATFGRKCLEQFGRFNHVGLWAKTFSELLIGTGGWFSMRCKLTWKLKGTKYKRMYFQLAPSTPRTAETGFGLLPTVTLNNENGRREDFSPSLLMAVQKLLPTPTAMDSTGATANMKSTQVKEGSMHSVTLSRAMAAGMLPTPMSQDGQNSTAPASQAGRDTLPGMVAATGTTSQQLNPQFVLEMMGFPPDWTELPFLSGETKASRQPQTR